MKTGTWLSALATVLGVSLWNIHQFWGKAGFWTRILFLLAVCAIVSMAIIDIRTWWKNRPRRYRTEAEINDYMYRLLSRGGSATIFAHKLSWIRDAPKVKDLLKRSARGKKNICIFVPRHNDLTEELAEAGVTVKTYESLDYEPESRFTVLNAGEPGSSVVAFGKGAVPDFYIEELSDDSHARVIAVVRDLLKIVDKASCRENA